MAEHQKKTMSELPDMIMEDEEVFEVVPILQFLTYVASRKASVKVSKDLDKVQAYINMPLILENVSLKGDMFTKVQQLKWRNEISQMCINYLSLHLKYTWTT